MLETKQQFAYDNTFDLKSMFHFYLLILSTLVYGGDSKKLRTNQNNKMTCRDLLVNFLYLKLIDT